VGKATLTLRVTIVPASAAAAAPASAPAAATQQAAAAVKPSCELVGEFTAVHVATYRRPVRPEAQQAQPQPQAA
jgi:hypothetical protein